MSQATETRRQRQHLHFDALVRQVRRRFEKIPDRRKDPDFSLADTLMAGLALYSLKDPSLLAFQRRARDPNLRSVFGLEAIPSDSRMREILDEVAPDQLFPVFTDIFRQLQRGKVLEDYVFLDGYYLLSFDGVEYFCSDKVHCPHCMTRTHRNGKTSYYHQLLGAVIIHPDHSEVFPIAPEPIQRQDGQQKNDCERNAARRKLQRFRKDHPHLRVIVVEDAISSNAPHIRDLILYNCRFILGVKPGDHAHLFEQFEQRLEANEVEGVHEEDEQGCRSWLFVEGLSLNESNQEVKVNFLKYIQIDADGTVHEWAWVTDLKLTKNNVKQVARGGRARWRIENEVFNTLKNQGYHFEHNFGHGRKNLGVVFALLMMQAFLIDQVQQRCNKVFQKAREKAGPKIALWEAVRNLFYSFKVESMHQIYEAIAFGFVRPALTPLVDSVKPLLEPVQQPVPHPRDTS
jgi:hypothetical protein